MKYKTNKSKSCDGIYTPTLGKMDKHFCSGACKNESLLNNLNQFENQLDKEFNKTKEAVLNVILIVFFLWLGFIFTQD